MLKLVSLDIAVSHGQVRQIPHTDDRDSGCHTKIIGAKLRENHIPMTWIYHTRLCETLARITLPVQKRADRVLQWPLMQHLCEFSLEDTSQEAHSENSDCHAFMLCLLSPTAQTDGFTSTNFDRPRAWRADIHHDPLPNLEALEVVPWSAWVIQKPGRKGPRSQTTG